MISDAQLTELIGLYKLTIVAIWQMFFSALPLLVVFAALLFVIGLVAFFLRFMWSRLGMLSNKYLW